MPMHRSLSSAARTAVLFAAGSCLFAAGAARADDEIVTKSGTKYRGKLVGEDATHYVLDTPDLGTMRVAKTDVAKVNPDPATAKAAKPAEKADPNAPARPGSKDPLAKPGGTSPAQKPDGGTSRGGGPQGTPAADAKPAEPVGAAEEARKEKERIAEQEKLDAAARQARRKATTLLRRTEPGADRAPAVAVAPVQTEQEIQHEKDREAISGAQFTSTAQGTQVVVFEPPRPFAAATSGVQLGRRTWARFEVGGAATATLTVTVAEKSERLALRLADVQRHVVAKSDASRVRILEGVDDGAWLRIRMDDGSVTSGRFVAVNDTRARLRVPADDGTPSNVDVDVTKIVQVDGLVPAASIARALGDLEPGDPVGLVLWPDAREFVGRFVDRMEHAVRLDQDGDGEPETIVAVDAPIAEVRRIPAQWRELARTLRSDAIVRVRGFEEFADARVERSFTAPVASVTAYAVCVRLDDGCAIVPFDSLVSLEPATPSDAAAALRRLEISAVDLPVLPGAAAEDAQAKTLPDGVSFVSDGRSVTHVYVAAPYERNVCGLRVGTSADEVLPYAEVNFGIEVQPKGGEPSERRRELISETVDGLRVTAYVDAKGTIGALEITRR